MRSFDPVRVGRLEARAWETYYRREWRSFLVASVGLVRSAFRMSWPKTLVGAWLVLRANQVWAPFPDNDPGKARALMRAFYGDARHRRPGRAPRSWRSSGGGSTASTSTSPGRPAEPLTDALAALYAQVYDADPGAVREAAALRAEAMDVSDRWVEAGCDADSPMLGEERALLVRSYASLLAAVHR